MPRPRALAWLLTFPLLLSGDQPRLSTPNQCWSSAASPATPHRYHSVAVFDGKIYAVGGEVSAGFEVYDPQQDSWASLPQMPEPRAFLAAVAANGRVYALGGLTPVGVPVARVDEYDIARKSWTRRADMPTARDRLAAVFVDGRILAIGGFVSNRNLDVVEEYDPTTDKWSQGPALPVGRHGHAAIEVNGRVFVLGGYETAGTVLVSPLSRTVELDRRAGTWRERASLPHARGFFGAVATRHYIYTLGGRTRDGAPVERYDTHTDAWEVVGQMPSLRQRFGAGAVGEKIIVVGGEESPKTAAIYDARCRGADTD